MRVSSTVRPFRHTAPRGPRGQTQVSSHIRLRHWSSGMGVPV
ncbi:hypothetical protein SVEN_2984 [Streptomyces venezuelae ATCC 10712]|uniref:Uncharacterized protein n=1 Tax=Streptomyces venezuelae (strain ATCC 10712 / CBS 650.69 / DSM 40230 / JCM 4526 / NBRC 13096 / PD 04745) TaxID=953739 RepID=F2R7I5_STRVP|nr:hypothetical protein SVEN_2984 [Streptomyces venezuelae ATCC 10712]